MKTIWIIHNSKYGNSEKISKQLAEGLIDEYEVRVENINKISLEDIAKDDPYGLIVAIRIVAFRSDKEILEFIKNLDKVIRNPISKLAFFSTHALGWKKFFIKGMKKTIEKIGCVENVCPEYLEVKMEKAEGPAIEGSDAKIQGFVSVLKQFMK